MRYVRQLAVYVAIVGLAVFTQFQAHANAVDQNNKVVRERRRAAYDLCVSAQESRNALIDIINSAVGDSGPIPPGLDPGLKMLILESRARAAKFRDFAITRIGKPVDCQKLRP